MPTLPASRSCLVDRPICPHVCSFSSSSRLASTYFADTLSCIRSRPSRCPRSLSCTLRSLLCLLSTTLPAFRCKYFFGLTRLFLFASRIFLPGVRILVSCFGPFWSTCLSSSARLHDLLPRKDMIILTTIFKPLQPLYARLDLMPMPARLQKCFAQPLCNSVFAPRMSSCRRRLRGWPCSLDL